MVLRRISKGCFDLFSFIVIEYLEENRTNVPTLVLVILEMNSPSSSQL